MSRGIYPGRFQPFHLGHLGVIKWALKKVDELVILIGSAQESHTLTNPFTAGERIDMIKDVLEEEKIWDRTILVPIPDILMNSVWPQHVKMYSPNFDIVFARNPLVIRLFKEAGWNVIEPPLFDRDKYNSTNIRKQIILGDTKWKNYVHRAISKYIEDIGGDVRLREIVGTDKMSISQD